MLCDGYQNGGPAAVRAMLRPGPGYFDARQGSRLSSDHNSQLHPRNANLMQQPVPENVTLRAAQRLQQQ